MRSSVLFGALHGRRLAGTVAGMFYAWWVYRRGRVGDAVIAHATTNGLIAADVLVLGHGIIGVEEKEKGSRVPGNYERRGKRERGRKERGRGVKGKSIFNYERRGRRERRKGSRGQGNYERYI